MTTIVAVRRIAAARTPVHPKGTDARVLLSSVFGPYAQDDEYGSRTLNPMELYHNQVTREQRAFSLRIHNRSFGLLLIQANIRAACTLLDFPSLDRFVQEITTRHYDIVGISSIMVNVAKVRKMCQLVRRHLPSASIVVGGHVANFPHLDTEIDADHIVRGEGVRWMRSFLGEDEARPIRHPHVPAGLGARAMGIAIRRRRGEEPAILIPSVGCPIGCNFCSTSAMFGGKGKHIDFYKTGDELFEVMCELERAMQVRSFFVLDENFLLHRSRALRLLELMIQHDKSWELYVFSSARTLRTYSMEQIVGLGIVWVWMGLEGQDSRYTKLRGIDTMRLVRTLQSHGICVLGSTIIGLENHTPENIDTVIDFAVGHDTEFHQFMLYTPVPGTPLYAEHRDRELLLDPSSCSVADSHGQLKFNFRHLHISDGQETEFLLRAFRRDYAVNGPSIVRMARTLLRGWRRYKNHPDQRIRRRFAWSARELPIHFASGLWAARQWFRSNPSLAEKISAVLKEIHQEFGLRSRLIAPLAGRYIGLMLAREERRLQRGWTYEPPTFCEAKPASPQ